MVIRTLCMLFLLALSASAQTPRIPPPESVNRNGLVGRWLVPGISTGNGLAPAQSGTASISTALPHWSSSRFGFLYNASTTFAFVPDSNQITPGTGAFSLVVRARIEKMTGDFTVFGKFQNAIRHEYLAGRYGGTWYFVLYSDTSTSGNYIGRGASLPVVSNQWASLAFVCRGGTTSANLEIWADGRRLDSSDLNAGTYTGTPDTDVPLFIGCDMENSGAYRNRVGGSLGDARYYNRALSAAEIAAIYRGLQ
jgi:hypothetical protein